MRHMDVEVIGQSPKTLRPLGLGQFGPGPPGVARGHQAEAGYRLFENVWEVTGDCPAGAES
jgi:hypothetical protein